jgi:hypothetical protein
LVETGGISSIQQRLRVALLLRCCDAAMLRCCDAAMLRFCDAAMLRSGGSAFLAAPVTPLFVAIAVGQMALDFHCILEHAADADEVGLLEAI